MNISKILLGVINETQVYQYTLENDFKMVVQVLTLGASLQSITLPFSDGSYRNIILSYADWEMYHRNPLYLGATLAPNAGRIEGGELPIYDNTYFLSQNEGKHNAHGGFHNASLQNWSEVSTLCEASGCSVTLKICLPDGLDGYPGERCIQTCYTLANDNELTILYHAITDKETYFNISNHAYFNLSGDFKCSGLEQQLETNASRYVANNLEHLPSAILKCSDTPFDFHCFISFADNISLFPNHEQLSIACGYNNAFVFDDDSKQVRKTLCLRDKTLEYRMELFTDAPCAVIYSGGYVDDSWSLADGFRSSNSCAIAIEAQDVPNTPNFLPDHCHYSDPNHPYSRTIRYKFISQPQSNIS